MRRALALAGGEIRLMLRTRVAALGLLILLALSLVAAATSFAHMKQERETRSAHQAAADRLFDMQPARHPHRVVHYGSFAHRPLGVLAAFDPGVDRYTGTTLYLEGHRQNVDAFGAARESSGLIRFGELTPAFVLQTATPLLLVFIGFGCVARERERGQLAQLLALGVKPSELVVGKSLALLGVALLAMLPALAALAGAGLLEPAEAPGAGVIALASGLHLSCWVLLIVSVSALCRDTRASLIVLVAAWAVTAVVMPRLAADAAERMAPQPTSVETDLAIQADLRRLGDSHNPDDPFFSDIRRRTLRQFGVERVEELPLNYRGLVSMEGEKLTSQLFARYAATTATAQLRQQRIVDRFAVASPAIAVSRITAAAAGTDLSNHLRFLEQAEAFRYDMVQRLNHLHTHAVDFADDSARSSDAASERRSRIGREHWESIPSFRFEPAGMSERLTLASSAIAALLAWVIAAFGALVFAARRLGRATR